MPMLAFAVMLLASAGAVHGVETPKWLGVFTPLPGARELCSQNVLGQDEDNDRVEINYTLYTSTREPADVVQLLGQAHGASWKPGQTTLTIKRDGDRKVLTVSPASGSLADCGVKPDRNVRSFIMVSEIIRSGIPVSPPPPSP